jgi:hypothetical protein
MARCSKCGKTMIDDCIFDPFGVARLHICKEEGGRRWVCTNKSCSIGATNLSWYPDCPGRLDIPDSLGEMEFSWQDFNRSRTTHP